MVSRTEPDEPTDAVDSAITLVRRFSPEQLIDFRNRFAAIDAERWDKELESDVLAGRLDELADAALASNSGGRTREL